MNKTTKTVSTYVSVKATVSKGAEWYMKLYNAMKKQGVNVDWHRQITFHQTLVFIKQDTCIPALKEELPKVVLRHRAFTQKIDKLDAFTTSDKKTHVICLTSTEVCPEMAHLVNAVKDVVENKGLDYDKRDFLLHITLGMVSTNDISLGDLQDILSSIELPTFNLLMEDVEYRYKGDGCIKSWTLKPKLDEERIRRAFANAASNIQLAIDPDM